MGFKIKKVGEKLIKIYQKNYSAFDRNYVLNYFMKNTIKIILSVYLLIYFDLLKYLC